MESQQPNPKGSNCPICDRPLVPELGEGWKLTRGTSPRAWFQTHCESDHPDYLEWKRSNRRFFRTLGIIGGIIAVSIVYLALYLSGWKGPSGLIASRAYGVLTVAIGIAGLVLTRVAIGRWGIRKFRKQWNERGGVPVASFDLNTSKS